MIVCTVSRDSLERGPDIHRPEAAPLLGDMLVCSQAARSCRAAGPTVVQASSVKNALPCLLTRSYEVRQLVPAEQPADPVCALKSPLKHTTP